MSTDIIKFDSLSQDDIQKNIETYLAGSVGYDSLRGSKGLDLITELLAGFGSLILYNNQTLREETHIETMKLDSSIELAAIDSAYRFNRVVTPKISVLYTGTGRVLSRGQKIGSYENLDIIYTGLTISLKTGQKIEGSVGALRTKTLTIDKTAGIWTIDIIPDNGFKVEDSILSIKNSKDIEYSISKNLEDLYLGYAVDYSRGPNSARVYLYDEKLNKGSIVNPDSTAVVTYLETAKTFTLSSSKVSLTPELILDSVLTQGAPSDNHEYVRKLLPFYRGTSRRAVSGRDYTPLLKGFNFFKDCTFTYIPKGGLPKIHKLTLGKAAIGDTFVITAKASSGAFRSTPIEESFTVQVTANNVDNWLLINQEMKLLIDEKSDLLRFIEPGIGQVIFLEEAVPSANASLTLNRGSKLYYNEAEVTNPRNKEDTGIVYYTHISHKDGAKALTSYEENLLVRYFEPLGLVGHQIDHYPASEHKIEINLQVTLLSPMYKEPYEKEIARMQEAVNFTINSEINVDEILKQLGLFVYEGERYVKALNSPNQGILKPHKNSYVNLSIQTVFKFQKS